ncbi:MAG: ABC transporter substrate-binding protein [Geminicoccaceae bacterium]|nr:ABC transporter substrate-binding protein [Geminicoccaceae bacterium]
MALPAFAADLGKVTVGVLAYGTVNWELDVIEAHGLDAKNGFGLEVARYGGNDAADVAFMGGAVDAIVEDWLWASRLRAEGTKVVFIPYSSTVGALMVSAGSGIKNLADLKGKKVGVAGGPLDKSWLLIQARAKQEGIDLKAETEQVFGAPPLLTEKLRSGELDALVNYWHYAARLEAEGYRRLLGVAEAQEALGVPPSTPQIGYIFKEDWARAHPDLVDAFAKASREAKAIMASSDAEWERLRPLTKAEDAATLDALKTRYREGIVAHWGDEERAEAARLYRVLADLGGEKLVGSSPVLSPGTFWDGVRY